jgi:hypothetical protein
MRHLRGGGGAVPPTPVSASVARPATEAPASPSALQVVVATLDRILGSDARTERTLLLLRPILFAGVLAVMGVALIVVVLSATSTWGSLVPGLGLTVASAGAVIVRRVITRRQRRRNPSPASVVAPTTGEATTTREGRCRKPRPQQRLPSNQPAVGENCSGPRCALGKGCAIVPATGATATVPVVSPTVNRGGRQEEQNLQ